MPLQVPDAVIEDSVILTKDTTVIFGVDWTEVDGETFTISSGTVTIFDQSDAAASSALTDMTAAVTTGNVSGEIRVQVTIAKADFDIDAGQYYARWVLVLGDAQERRVRQPIRVREVA